MAINTEADANLKGVTALAVTGATKNFGQRCTAAKVIVMVEGVAEASSKLVIEKAKRVKCGDPSASDTDVGPVINERPATLFRTRVSDAVRHGPEIMHRVPLQGAVLSVHVKTFAQSFRSSAVAMALPR